MFYDLTERRRAETELQLRDRAIQAVSQGILITDPNQAGGPIVFANPAVERLTGYSLEELLGRSPQILLGKDTDATAIATIRDAVANRQACAVELLNYRKNGTTFWNALTMAPVWDSGRLTHLIWVQTDVTERRMLEEQYGKHRR
jgi:two-component system cell cycle sensor histidine kinase/response regulator CckA